VFVLSNGGGTFYLTTAGNGTLTQLSPSTSASDPYFPALMYANGKVLSLRNDRKVAIVNLAGTQPTITNTQDIDQVRAWSNATVLADGKVLVNGGSTVGNELTGVAYAATIWNPATGQWAPAATAAKARLYHSTSLLLPDGSVLTAGGGAPGPVNNLNAELYYPPYLFKKNGSGQPADRPTIISAQTGLYANQQFTVTVGSTAPINRVTLVRTGSVTHSFNPDQRFVQLSFTQSGQTLTARLPASRNIVPPGYYLLFVFKAGVPSVAKIIQIVG
jgi:galactose oxidase-like protein